MLKMNNRYKELLNKFASNKDIYELLELVILDDVREREKYYLNNQHYPEKRNLINKLKVDLETVLEYNNK